MNSTSKVTRFQLRAKHDLTGNYDFVTYKKGELFRPWSPGEGSPLLTQEFIDKAYRENYVTNKCGFGCTDWYKFPDSFDIETVTIEETVNVEIKPYQP